MSAPPLSLLIPTREPFSAVMDKLDAAAAEVATVGGEVVVVGGGGEEPLATDTIRFVPTRERDMFRLRSIGFAACRGDVVAIGEDHAAPVAGWAKAVVSAHAAHRDVPIVVGCLENLTTRTTGNRANFMTYASQVVVPMDAVPDRPPAVSVISIKRGPDLELGAREPGRFETEVIPRLHDQKLMVADDRIVFDHYQPFGVVRSMRNAFRNTRASYGYARELSEWPRSHRRWITRWALRHIAPRLFAEARQGRLRTNGRRRDLVPVALVAAAGALGAVIGTNFGAGKAPQRLV